MVTYWEVRNICPSILADTVNMQKESIRERGAAEQKNSGTGTRTRVSDVKSQRYSHLNHTGYHRFRGEKHWNKHEKKLLL